MNIKDREESNAYPECITDVPIPTNCGQPYRVQIREVCHCTILSGIYSQKRLIENLKNLLIGNLNIFCSVLLNIFNDFHLHTYRKLFDFVHSFINSSGRLAGNCGAKDFVCLQRILFLLLVCECVLSSWRGLCHALCHTQSFAF